MNSKVKKFTRDSLTNFISENKARLTYDSWASVELNFLYINIPKAGCTKIKKMLQAISGLPVPEDVTSIHARASGSFVKSICDFNIQELLYLFNSDQVKRICFVRNPYTRLLSGYWNKVAGPKKYGTFNERIFKLEGILDTDRNPKLFELLRFILKENSASLDIHFRSQSKLCHYDLIDYNRIGYFEDFQNDIIRIFSELGASKEVLEMSEYVENPSFKNTTLQSKLLIELKNNKMGDRFYNSFIDDFINFDYEKL